MLLPTKEELKKKFAENRSTREYQDDFERLKSLEFQDFMKEYLDFYQRVEQEMKDELGTKEISIEEREWYYLYYGGELYFDVIKYHQWGKMVDMALALIEKEQ